MTADTLRDLAARVEGLSGPDREVDALVYETTAGAIDYQRIGIRLPMEKWPDRYHDGWVTVYGAKGEDDPYPEPLPRYTASLDAAMSLVPKGSVWLRKSPETMSVYTPPVDEKVWATHIDANGATPALALTAASLRALAALDEGR